jgi:hypothetical protein
MHVAGLLMELVAVRVNVLTSTGATPTENKDMFNINIVYIINCDVR